MLGPGQGPVDLHTQVMSVNNGVILTGMLLDSKSSGTNRISLGWEDFSAELKELFLKNTIKLQLAHGDPFLGFQGKRLTDGGLSLPASA